MKIVIAKVLYNAVLFLLIQLENAANKLAATLTLEQVVEILDKRFPPQA